MGVLAESQQTEGSLKFTSLLGENQYWENQVKELQLLRQQNQQGKKQAGTDLISTLNEIAGDDFLSRSPSSQKKTLNSAFRNYSRSTAPGNFDEFGEGEDIPLETLKEVQPRIKKIMKSNLSLNRKLQEIRSLIADVTTLSVERAEEEPPSIAGFGRLKAFRVKKKLEQQQSQNVLDLLQKVEARTLNNVQIEGIIDQLLLNDKIHPRDVPSVKRLLQGGGEIAKEFLEGAFAVAKTGGAKPFTLAPGSRAFIQRPGEAKATEIARGADKPTTSPKTFEQALLTPNLPTKRRAEILANAKELKRAQQKKVSGVELSAKEKLQLTNDTIKTFRGDQRIKSFETIDFSFKSMEQLAKQATGAEGFIALDQGLITLFNKITDPNSVVRESEFARTEAGQGYLDRVQGFFQRVAKGGAGITQENRESLVEAARAMHAIAQGKANEVRADFTQIASEAGLNPELIVGRTRARKELGDLGFPELPPGLGPTSKVDDRQEQLRNILLGGQ